MALQIDNMHCGACVRRVTQTLNALPMTHAEAVQVGSARVTTEAALENMTRNAIRALEGAGFPARVVSALP